MLERDERRLVLRLHRLGEELLVALGRGRDARDGREGVHGDGQGRRGAGPRLRGCGDDGGGGRRCSADERLRDVTLLVRLLVLLVLVRVLVRVRVEGRVLGEGGRLLRDPRRGRRRRRARFAALPEHQRVHLLHHGLERRHLLTQARHLVLEDADGAALLLDDLLAHADHLAVDRADDAGDGVRQLLLESGDDELDERAGEVPLERRRDGRRDRGRQGEAEGGAVELLLELERECLRPKVKVQVSSSHGEREQVRRELSTHPSDDILDGATHLRPHGMLDDAADLLDERGLDGLSDRRRHGLLHGDEERLVARARCRGGGGRVLLELQDCGRRMQRGVSPGARVSLTESGRWTHSACRARARWP